MKIGYARVSTAGQELASQLDALKAAGCERIYTDQASGGRADRPGLADALSYARPGDVLVCVALDRLGRSLRHLIELVDELQRRGVGLASLREAIDTSTSGGRMVFQIFGALAEFERSLIQERTRAGLEAARARGRQGGRPALAPETIAALRALSSDPNTNVTAACKALNISRATFYKYAGPATE